MSPMFYVYLEESIRINLVNRNILIMTAEIKLYTGKKFKIPYFLADKLLTIVTIDHNKFYSIVVKSYHYRVYS